MINIKLFFLLGFFTLFLFSSLSLIFGAVNIDIIKLLEDDIDDFKNTPSTKNFRDYHIVGTEIYERECKN